MKTYTLLAIFAFTLFACNNNTAKDKNNEEPMATSEVKQTETESTFNVTPISVSYTHLTLPTILRV